MSENFFIKFALESLDETKDTHLEHFDKLSDILMSLFISRIDKKINNFKNERLYFINLITQKFLLHISSVKKLMDGILLESSSKDLKLNLSDPFSIHILVRGAMENYLVLNYLSNRFENKDLLEARFDIWMRYGIKQRGIVPESDEEKKILEIDSTSINTLTDKIKSREFFKALSSQKKDTFLRQINKDWKFEFKDDTYRRLSWKDLLYLSGMKENLGENMYNYLSWHAHTQSISVLQVKDMWNDGFDQFSIKNSINKLNMFISFVISDLVCNDDDFKKVYSDLSEDMKGLVNFHNFSNKGVEYVIDQENFLSFL